MANNLTTNPKYIDKTSSSTVIYTKAQCPAVVLDGKWTTLSAGDDLILHDIDGNVVYSAKGLSNTVVPVFTGRKILTNGLKVKTMDGGILTIEEE